MATFSISSSFIIHHMYAIENNFTASHTNTHTSEISLTFLCQYDTVAFVSLCHLPDGGRMEKERERGLGIWNVPVYKSNQDWDLKLSLLTTKHHDSHHKENRSDGQPYLS